jgi:uncharacterized SAM-binding protein YcdF (DUF218 family)
MVLLVTDVFLLLTQVLLWILVGLAARFVLLKALPKAFLGSLVLVLLVVVAALTFFNGSPAPGLLGDVWQLISVILNPFGLLVIVLCVFLRDFEQNGKANKILLRAGVLSLLIFSLPLVSNFLVKHLETGAVQLMRVGPPLQSGRRVIVLMGQNTTRLKLNPRQDKLPEIKKADRSGFLRPPDPISEEKFGLLANLPLQLTDQGDRILGAAQAFYSERANNPLLIVSGGIRNDRMTKTNEKKENISEAADISKLLQSQFGIPGTAIIQDDDSRSVIESAQNVRKILESKSINYGNQIMVVTSALEASRTEFTFEREILAPDGRGATIISRPTDFYTIPQSGSLVNLVKNADLVERNLMVSDFLPSADALQLSTKMLNEVMTSLYYFLRGWIRTLSR